MNDCPQCTATMRGGVCAECGYTSTQAKPANNEPKNAGLRWSPETPPVDTLPKWTGPRWEVTPAIQAELDRLKATLTTPARQVDPAKEQAYLKACRERPRAQEAPR